MESLKRSLVALMVPRTLSFLEESNYQRKMNNKVANKIDRLKNITLGKELGVSGSTSIKDLPLTKYEAYKKYYEDPREQYFLYELNDYLTSITSGTMGQPKKFLLPKTALMDNLRKTALASLFIVSHDGERVTFEIGDTMYSNIPGGSQLAALMTELGMKNRIAFVKNCPDPNLPFQVKVDYFVNNYKNIDMAYMTVTTLMDQVYPRIGEPLHLKGFMTQDSSSLVFKDQIKKITGSYPKTTYGATEIMIPTVASIEHPGCFIFDWRVLYAEFVPDDQKIEDGESIIKANVDVVDLSEVEPGKRYQLIATPYMTETTRYVMPDVLQCVDTGDDVLNSQLPVFKYHARSDKIIVLHNFTRIVEEEITQVLKDANVPFVDYTVINEQDGTHDYMKMYLELSNPMDPDTVYRMIDERLTEFDRDWYDLKGFLKYDPLRIELLPKGSFRHYLQHREGMTRIERVQMKKERLDLLLSFKDS
jgi:phenylacetate-coenzyme A ligase PaaK-like adenylate-forming protein